MEKLSVNQQNLHSLVDKHLQLPVQCNCFRLSVKRKYKHGHGDVYVASLKRDINTTWRVVVPVNKFPGSTRLPAVNSLRNTCESYEYLNSFLAAVVEWLARYTNKGYSEETGFSDPMKVVGLGHGFAVIAPDYS